MSEDLYRYNCLKEATRLVQVEGFDKLADDILTRVVIDTIRRYQTKLNVGVQDSVGDLLDTFKQKITEAIFDASNSWRVASNQQPFIFPRGCRFCYTRGTSTIIVIEEDPKVRSLTFDNGMLGAEPGYTNNQRRLTLALPYVVFLLHFQRGQFRSLYSGWRRGPLSGLEDLLYKPLLPNVHDNLNVCLGRGLPQASGIPRMTEVIITHFWSSRFNHDLADAWWSKGTVSDKLRTALTWEAASEENPMFILNLDFSRITGARTVQYMLDLLCRSEETPDESAFRHNFSEEVDKCVEALFSKILRYLKKTKFDKHYPKDITSRLQEVLAQATGEFAEVVHVLDQEIKGLSDHVRNADAPITPRGSGWVDFPLDL